MIPKASQRAGGSDLATHLLNAHDNEIVVVDHVRGAIADDLHGAFKEWEVQAATLTRCEQYLYSLSINPDPAQSPLTRDQYMDYIVRAERALGLDGQPRAVVFHTKYGREHCHVVWSRIDPEHGKAVHLAFNHEKLMNVTRAFARDHGLKLPPGYELARKAGKESLYDREKQRQTGLSKADHMRQVTDAWFQSDSAAAFVRALEARGYVLATGERDYVLVDAYGGIHALPRMIDDKGVRTKHVRERLGKAFPPESLPSVEEARALVNRHRTLMEEAKRDELVAVRLAELKHHQASRRQGLEREWANLDRRHCDERDVLLQRHRIERDALRSRQRQVEIEIKRERAAREPRGLAGFLARVSGVVLVRRALQRREDARRRLSHVDERKLVRAGQRDEQRLHERQVDLRNRDMERRVDDLRAIEARELKSLKRDVLRDLRVEERGSSDRMPPLDKAVGRALAKQRPGLLEPDLLSLAAHDLRQSGEQVPDLMREFNRATGGGGQSRSSEEIRQVSADRTARGNGTEIGRRR